ncbi:hypothetical protein J6590_049542 [Homalodisca vitripennis]|nr:hypothetical protein J6590_049542 [Homalodisca vitripennis]
MSLRYYFAKDLFPVSRGYITRHDFPDVSREKTERCRVLNFRSELDIQVQILPVTVALFISAVDLLVNRLLSLFYMIRSLHRPDLGRSMLDLPCFSVNTTLDTLQDRGIYLRATGALNSLHNQGKARSNPYCKQTSLTLSPRELYKGKTIVFSIVGP